MRISVFFLAVFFSITYSLCQSTSEIEKIINDLSWDSYRVHHSYRTFFVSYDETYYKLIKDKKRSGELLFKFIDKPDKTVAIHTILTLMFEPDRNYLFPQIDFYTCKYFKKDLFQLAGTHFIYNGLVWEVNQNGPPSITKSQIERIKHLWDLRLHKDVDSFNLDPDSIIKAVRQTDSKIYGNCETKKYENNSGIIKISELQSLIGSNYQSRSFNVIFKKLGNDSTIYYRRNRSEIETISYETDGIDFEFDFGNNLRCIFIKPHYKGLLFNNLKMTDNKDAIKRKLGEPEEFENKPRYKYDWIYEKYKMLIAFGYANRIIDLQINNGINP